MITSRAAIASVMFTSFVGAALTAVAGEQTGTLAGRTELHVISTLTLSDAQFLAGDANATPTNVTGQLRVAQRGPADGRPPVVVLMHGSGGMGPNIEMWAEELNAMGISSFALDGFTGRGLIQVSTDQAKLGRLNFILDIYRSLDVLAKHPRVDPTRIALMGFSRGGQAALYASLTRFHKTWNKSGVEFAAYLPFYPDCATTFVGDTDVANRPIRIFGGTPDDYNPIALCKPYVERLRAAGREVVLTEYPNAPHGFDNPLGTQPPTAVAQAQSVRHCQIREEPVGLLINAASKQPFNYNDPCVERGAHIGGDPAAAAAAKSTVKGVLAAAFRLD